jgi:hypothetical protein
LAPITVITILAFTLLVTALLLARLPVATCAQCTHCQLEALARERENEDRVGRYYGMPRCAACGGYHAREEPHRR